jgi:hypothetical protein
MKAVTYSIALLFFLRNQTSATSPASSRRPTVATLKKGMKLQVILSGQQKSWVDVPSGGQVQVLHVRKQQVMIGIGDSQAWVKRSDTDFDQRLTLFEVARKEAQVKVQQAQAAQDATFQKQKAKVSADFQKQHANYANPLDKGAYNQTRSVVDYYDGLGRRYHIGSHGQRIYQ